MKDHAIRILADQVAAHFHRAGGAGFGVVLQHFTPASDSRIGRDLYEDPGILKNKRFNFGDFDVVLGAGRRRLRTLRREQSVEPKQRPRRQCALKQ